MTPRKKQIAGFLVTMALAGFGCHREQALDRGQPGVDNRKLTIGVHLLEDGTSCAVDYPVARLSKGHNDMAGWYSSDGHKFRIDFEAGKGPFKHSDTVTTRTDNHVVWGGPLKDEVAVDHYFAYSVTLDGVNQPCKTAQPSKPGDYDPGLYVTR
jgi:hypothetical protein